MTDVEQLRAHRLAAIAVGGSAGSIEALMELLPWLPATLTVPVAVVVHLPPAAASGLAPVLASACALTVVEAEDKMTLQPGWMYVAPADYHLLVERGRTLALSADPPVHFSRPSIDVLFESAAFAFGRFSLAILLSGANADGAAGLATVKAHGGLTWVQEPASARVPHMPEAALALTSHAVMRIEDMGRTLAEWGYAGA